MNIVASLLFLVPSMNLAPQEKKVGETITVKGKLEWSNNGGGFWSLKGASGGPYVLRGSRSTLQGYASCEVEIKGKISGKDTWGTVLDVESIKLVKADTVSPFPYVYPNPFPYPNVYPYPNIYPYYCPMPYLYMNPYYNPYPNYYPNPYYNPFPKFDPYNPFPKTNPYYYPTPNYYPYPKMDPYYLKPTTPYNPMPYYPSGR